MAQCFNRFACPRFLFPYFQHTYRRTLLRAGETSFLFTYFQHNVDHFFIMASYSIK
ncbi:hypothetical protein I656_03666 [Geobacillus sp. WSUCF1]|nr:hypothetical protein I656_03666 [Geobacillus sp. WSUCF1]